LKAAKAYLIHSDRGDRLQERHDPALGLNRRQTPAAQGVEDIKLDGEVNSCLFIKPVLYSAPSHQHGSVVSAEIAFTKPRIRSHADHKKSSPQSEKREEVA
jgi:hypothetical protein